VRAATGAAAAAEAAAVAEMGSMLISAVGRVTVAVTAVRLSGAAAAGGMPLPLLLPLLGAVGGA
jgi:hypothetical protein